MRKANDPVVQWLTAWLFHVMYPNPRDLQPKVRVSIRSHGLETANGRAYKNTFPDARGRPYLITVYRKCTDDFLAKVLAHEIRHIEQYEEGRLHPKHDGWFWRGEFFSKKVPWEERPWEIEARQSEYLGYEALAAYRRMERAPRSETFIWYRRDA